MPDRVLAVEAGGIASELGIQPGDQLLTINGEPVTDLIDYQALTCQSKLALLTRRGDEEIEYFFEKDEYDPLGLTFERPLMSTQRDCVNHCLFCFVDQLPSNVRPTLRVKDDDWRMSLMMGNFVTLTNVSDAELSRMILRGASPLYISVHATDPSLRATLLGQKRGDQIMKQLTRLKDAGLAFHAQAVLCPGYNDGDVLNQTIADLAALYPAAQSLALVPVGLTAHREGLCPLRGFDAEGARAVMDQANTWRKRLKKQLGTRFVFPADEFYLKAGAPIPSEEAYEDFAQIENGVGLLRRLQTEFEEALAQTNLSGVAVARVLVACGTSIAPFLSGLLETLALPQLDVQVRAVENGFFGASVTVSGLLTGGDLLRDLAGERADRLLISANMLREGETVFLDDRSLQEVETALGIQMIPVDSGEALLNALIGRMGG